MQRSPKHRKISDFFQKELPNTEQQETEPEQQVMPMFLRHYQPTSVSHRKRPVGRPRHQSQPDAVAESQPESSQEPEGVACPVLLIIRPSGAECSLYPLNIRQSLKEIIFSGPNFWKKYSIYTIVHVYNTVICVNFVCKFCVRNICVTIFRQLQARAMHVYSLYKLVWVN